MMQKTDSNPDSFFAFFFSADDLVFFRLDYLKDNKFINKHIKNILFPPLLFFPSKRFISNNVSLIEMKIITENQKKTKLYWPSFLQEPPLFFIPFLNFLKFLKLFDYFSIRVQPVQIMMHILFVSFE